MLIYKLTATERCRPEEEGGGVFKATAVSECMARGWGGVTGYTYVPGHHPHNTFTRISWLCTCVPMNNIVFAANDIVHVTEPSTGLMRHGEPLVPTFVVLTVRHLTYRDDQNNAHTRGETTLAISSSMLYAAPGHRQTGTALWRCHVPFGFPSTYKGKPQIACPGTRPMGGGPNVAIVQPAPLSVATVRTACKDDAAFRAFSNRMRRDLTLPSTHVLTDVDVERFMALTQSRGTLTNCVHVQRSLYLLAVLLQSQALPLPPRLFRLLSSDDAALVRTMLAGPPGDPAHGLAAFMVPETCPVLFQRDDATREQDAATGHEVLDRATAAGGTDTADDASMSLFDVTVARFLGVSDDVQPNHHLVTRGDTTTGGDSDSDSDNDNDDDDDDDAHGFYDGTDAKGPKERPGSEPKSRGPQSTKRQLIRWRPIDPTSVPMEVRREMPWMVLSVAIRNQFAKHLVDTKSTMAALGALNIADLTRGNSDNARVAVQYLLNVGVLVAPVVPDAPAFPTTGAGRRFLNWRHTIPSLEALPPLTTKEFARAAGDIASRVQIVLRRFCATRLSNRTSFTKNAIDNAVARATATLQRQHPGSLVDTLQLRAAACACANPLFALEGGPGTGKTWTATLTAQALTLLHGTLITTRDDRPANRPIPIPARARWKARTAAAAARVAAFTKAATDRAARALALLDKVKAPGILVVGFTTQCVANATNRFRDTVPWLGVHPLTIHRLLALCMMLNKTCTTDGTEGMFDGIHTLIVEEASTVDLRLMEMLIRVVTKDSLFPDLIRLYFTGDTGQLLPISVGGALHAVTATLTHPRVLASLTEQYGFEPYVKLQTCHRSSGNIRAASVAIMSKDAGVPFIQSASVAWQGGAHALQTATSQRGVAFIVVPRTGALRLDGASASASASTSSLRPDIAMALRCLDGEAVSSVGNEVRNLVTALLDTCVARNGHALGAFAPGNTVIVTVANNLRVMINAVMARFVLAQRLPPTTCLAGLRDIPVLPAELQDIGTPLRTLDDISRVFAFKLKAGPGFGPGPATLTFHTGKDTRFEPTAVITGLTYDINIACSANGVANSERVTVHWAAVVPEGSSPTPAPTWTTLRHAPIGVVMPEPPPSSHHVLHLFVSSLNDTKGADAWPTVRTLVLDPKARSADGAPYCLALAHLGLGFATTAFKIQGGEAPVSIFVLPGNQGRIDARNINVAVTRAKAVALVLCGGEPCTTPGMPALALDSALLQSVRRGPSDRRDVLQLALQHTLLNVPGPWLHEVPAYDEYDRVRVLREKEVLRKRQQAEIDDTLKALEELKERSRFSRDKSTTAASTTRLQAVLAAAQARQAKLLETMAQL